MMVPRWRAVWNMRGYAQGAVHRQSVSRTGSLRASPIVSVVYGVAAGRVGRLRGSWVGTA